MDQFGISNSTEVNPTQREIPILAEVRRPTLVDWNVVAKCADEVAALQLCVHLSRLANETIADKLGIDKGHWTRIMQGRGNLPARKRTQLMSICGNLAPLQFDCLRFGFDLKDHDVDAELSRVEREREVLLARKQFRVAVAA